MMLSEKKDCNFCSYQIKKKIIAISYHFCVEDLKKSCKIGEEFVYFPIFWERRH